mmetsp:Transcript_10662/g.15488  ORF Transcript_10662/g.15488 Transcript_10662/m.15488 type:complete len:170 (-) Transcript_10662:814-1323(-)
MSSDNQLIYTTSAEDQAAAARLKERLSNSSSSRTASESNSTGPPLAWLDIPSVSIDNGAHKYVLISATEPAPREPNGTCIHRYFVVSKKGAAYHQNAAEPFVCKLEANGFQDIRIKGGGRISLDEVSKSVSIFGYSYGFGRADHAQSKSVIDADDRYKGYNVTWSNDGY